MRRGEDVDHNTTRDEGRGFCGRAVVLEQTKSARAPLALEIGIGSVGQQQIEQRQVLLRDGDGAPTKTADGRVDGGADLSILLEQRAHTLDVARMERVEKLFNRHPDYAIS